MPSSKPTVVSKAFSDDFESVAANYKLRELGEYDTAKAAARGDLDAAITTFASLANEIRGNDE